VVAMAGGVVARARWVVALARWLMATRWGTRWVVARAGLASGPWRMVSTARRVVTKALGGDAGGYTRDNGVVPSEWVPFLPLNGTESAEAMWKFTRRAEVRRQAGERKFGISSGEGGGSSEDSKHDGKEHSHGSH
jgi:hypothetical protein